MDNNYRSIPLVTIDRYNSLCNQLEQVSLKGQEISWLDDVLVRHNHIDVLNQINPADHLREPSFALNNFESRFERIFSSRVSRVLLSVFSILSIFIGVILLIHSHYFVYGMVFLGSIFSLITMCQIITSVSKIIKIRKQQKMIRLNIEAMQANTDWLIGWNRGERISHEGCYQAIYADLIESAKNIDKAFHLDLHREIRFSLFHSLLITVLLTIIAIKILLGAVLPYSLVSIGNIGLAISFGLVVVLGTSQAQDYFKRIYHVIKKLFPCIHNANKQNAMYKASIAMVYLVKARKLLHEYILGSSLISDSVLVAREGFSSRSDREGVSDQILSLAYRDENRMLMDSCILIPPPSYEESTKDVPPAYGTVTLPDLFKNDESRITSPPPYFLHSSSKKSFLKVENVLYVPLALIDLASALPQYSEYLPRGHSQPLSFDVEEFNDRLE